MKHLIIKLTDEEYNDLVERAKKEGYSLLSDYVRYLLTSCSGSTSQAQIDVLAITGKIERKIQDVLMPFASEIDTLKKQIAMVYEKLDEISANTRITQETRAPSHEERPQLQREMKETAPSEKVAEEKKRTAMSILKEQGASYESELNLRNPDAYFTKLENEGAKIIITEKERIAVHPDFYAKFVNDLSKIHTNDANEAARLLDGKEAKLFRKLVSEGLAYFDSESQTWKLIVETAPSEKVAEEKKRTAMSILKEQGASYESELNLRNPDAYFTKLENEGAKIIITEKERIAVHPDFYAKFVNDLSKIHTNDANEAARLLDGKEAKLFRKLVSEGLAYFDSESQTWKLLI